jgi:hypothetical protein
MRKSDRFREPNEGYCSWKDLEDLALSCGPVLLEDALHFLKERSRVLDALRDAIGKEIGVSPDHALDRAVLPDANLAEDRIGVQRAREPFPRGGRIAHRDLSKAIAELLGDDDGVGLTDAEAALARGRPGRSWRKESEAHPEGPKPYGERTKLATVAQPMVVQQCTCQGQRDVISAT